MEKRVKLAESGNAGAVTAQIAEGTSDDFGIRGDEVFSMAGDIAIEDYFCSKGDDGYSESEHSDIALVRSSDKEKVLSVIRQEHNQHEEDTDWEILHYLEKKFSSLGNICTWLLENHIPYRQFYDGNWGTYPSEPDERDAEQLARIAHTGQKDKAGADYIEHPLRVANTFTDDGIERDDYKRRGVINNLRIVSLLHDVLEDTWVTREFLKRCGYNKKIIAAIKALTKLPDEEGSDTGYEKFIHRAARNPLAIRVKIADIRDNIDLSRLPEGERSSAKVLSRMKRYQKALAYLESIDARRNLAGLRERLTEAGADFNPAAIKIDEYHRGTLTGFVRYSYTLRHEASGELFPQELLTEAMMAARDEGLDGHLSAREYDEYLQSLPPDSNEWDQETIIEYQATLARCRHLFLLALQQDLQATPAEKATPEEIANSNLQTLAIAARTLAQGILVDGSGHVIELPESNIYQEEDFKELRYPRYFLAEQGGDYSVICLRDEKDRGIIWDENGQAHRNWSVQSTFWWPLVTTDELDVMIQDGRLAPPSTEEISF